MGVSRWESIKETEEERRDSDEIDQTGFMLKVGQVDHPSMGGMLGNEKPCPITKVIRYQRHEILPTLT